MGDKMMKTRTLKTIVMIIAAVAVLVVASRALAQSYRARGHPTWYGPRWQHHASTYAEGVQRGWADVVRAMGDYNYMTSRGLINREEARRLWLENKQRYVEQYFELRRINREARAAERGPRPTAQDLARYAKERAPDRLDAYAYDRGWGELNWPAVLMDERFAAERDQIDLLMKQRSVYNSGVGTENNRQVVALSSQMTAKLKGQIDDMAPMDYVAAKSFLRSLSYESHFAPDLSAANVPATNTVAAKWPYLFAARCADRHNSFE